MLTVLYGFCFQENCSDGAYPHSGLTLGTDGDYYGTTAGGGASKNGGGASKNGTVFRFTADGQFTTLYSFTGYSDGGNPYGTLIEGADGDFYATPKGGSDCPSYGCGTIFRITPEGVLTTLYTFCRQTGCADGMTPYAGLIRASDGNFYGTTQAGGAFTLGTVFRLSPTGYLTTLYSFQNDPHSSRI